MNNIFMNFNVGSLIKFLKTNTPFIKNLSYTHNVLKFPKDTEL